MMTAPAPRTCRVSFLRKIQSRVPACHAAAIVRVAGGLGCFRVTEAPWKGGRAFCLDGRMLASGDTFGCPTCERFVHHGYGDGVFGPAERRRIGDALNAPYGGLETAAGRLAPILGLFDSGYYILADCDQYPSVPSRRVGRSGGGYAFSDFIRAGGCQDFDSCIRFMAGYPADEFHNVPLFLWASQRPADMNWQRVRHYMEAFEADKTDLPRPIAAYMNGAMSLVLDGHHKIAAAAMLGRPVRTTLVFRIASPEAVLPIIRDGGRLYFCAQGSAAFLREDDKTGKPVLRYEMNGAPPYLSDAAGRRLSEVSCWGNSPACPLPAGSGGKTSAGWPPWEDAECAFTRNYRPCHVDLPSMGEMEAGAHADPGRIRESLSALRQANALEEDDPSYGRDNDWRMLGDLIAYKRLFPDSKWISAEDLAWLMKVVAFGERQDYRLLAAGTGP